MALALATPMEQAKKSATLPTVHAGGGLIWRVAAKKLEVLLVHRPGYDDWSWPKGKVEFGETYPACAVREICEETGLAVVLGVPLPSVRYRLDDGRMKMCHYWAAQVVDTASVAVRARVVPPTAPKGEVDSVAWVSAQEARTLLTQKSDLAPLDALVDLWDEGGLDTRAFVLIRHGRAKKRSAWPGGETDRPLTAQGLHQASDATATLSAFGVAHLYSSPWERCVATVLPYALAAGIAVEKVPEITETAAREKPAAAKRAVHRLLASLRARASGSGTDGMAVCTHRPVLPELMVELAEHSPNRIKVLLPETNPYLKVGEMLVAHVLPRHRRGVRIVALERHRSH